MTHFPLLKNNELCGDTLRHFPKKPLLTLKTARMILLTFSFCASDRMSAKMGITPNLRKKEKQTFKNFKNCPNTSILSLVSDKHEQ